MTEVIEDHQVGQVAGGDGAFVVHQEIAGCLMAGHLDGNDGINAAGNGFPDDIIDVAALQKIQGVFIIGGKHAPGVVLLIEQRQECPQILGGGALPYHDELAELQLFQRILAGAALVIGIDAGGDIGVEIGAGEIGCVAIDFFVVGLTGQDFADDCWIAIDDTDIVHHFRQAKNSRVVIQVIDGLIIQRAAAFIQRRGGHAAGQHKVDIHRQALGGLQHIADAIHSHDIGDLVRIGDDSGGAVADDRSGKLGRGNQAAFQVDVGIDEAGADKAAGDIHLFAAVVAADAGDEPIGNSDIPMAEVIAEHIEIGGVFEYDIGRFLPARHADEAELAPQLALHALGGGFMRLHDSPSFYLYWVFFSMSFW